MHDLYEAMLNNRQFSCTVIDLDPDLTLVARANERVQADQEGLNLQADAAWDSRNQNRKGGDDAS